MSRAEVVAKLESLLARVRVRATEPRTVALPSVVHEPAPVAVHVQHAPPADEPQEMLAAPALTATVAPEPEVASDASAPEVQIGEVVVSEVSEVLVDEIVAEGTPLVAAEPLMMGETADSRERLIVAAPAPEAAPEAPLELDEPAAHAPPPAEEARIAAPAEVEVVLDEPVEEAPVSSRRAVVAPEPPERLAELAFGAEEPAPRHTPPPESGRLPAVPDAATVESDGDITGVREAASIQLSPTPPPLMAEATAPRLSPSDSVGEVVAPPAFTPSTFVALLDASLSL